ncbi:MAG: hypothetical protein GWN13_21270 [Phycisphaerae bacterium]|nr:hypothetical protein [Phycisphaerae bacterium]
MNLVFSLHDSAQVRSLITGAGFGSVSISSHEKSLRLPAPEDFLWQFVYSTPLAVAVAEAEEEHLASFEREVIAKWQQFAQGPALVVQVRLVTAIARKE